MNFVNLEKRLLDGLVQRKLSHTTRNSRLFSDHRVKEGRIDFSEPATESAIKLVTNVSDITNKQMDLIKQLVNSYSLPGTMVVPYEIMITLIYKEQP